MNLQYIGVVGAGSMGNGIAQICALADIHVTLLGANEDALKKAVDSIGKNLDQLIAKGELSEARKLAALNNILVQTDFTGLHNAQLVIEASMENFDWQQHVLQQIAEQVSSECVIASTSSSFSVTHLAVSLSQPERFIGLHFFNPESVMGLIEVIRGLQTSDATHELVLDLAAALGKTAITAGNHRILVPTINDAILEFQEGLTSAKDIDVRMRLGGDQPIGPLALADLIGLDTVLTILEEFYNGFNDINYRPAPLLEEMVAAGYLGLKTGHGFHAYA